MSQDIQPITTQGGVFTVISIISAYITLAQAQAVVSFLAGVIALISGCMAIRYYYHATKKMKA